jgi:hypothetical protein
MCIEQETARRMDLLGDSGNHPRYSTDQVLLQRLLDRGGLPSVGNLLSDSLEHLRFHERYAVQLEFFSMIVEEHPDVYRAMIREAKRLRGGGVFRKGMSEFVERHFDLEDLFAELHDRIASLSPAWYIDYRAFDVHGDRWTQAAFAETPGVAWRHTPVGESSYSLSGELELLGEEMSVLLDKDDQRHIRLSMRADGTLLAAHEEPGGTRELARATSDSLATAGGGAFRVEVEGPTVGLWIDGELELEFDAGRESLTGSWGLAVPDGGAGIWHGVELRL